MSCCFVPGCPNSQRKTPHLNFFAVTNKSELKDKWIEAIEKGTGCVLDRNLLNSPDTRICSSHFTFDGSSSQDGSHAIPSIFKLSFFMDDVTLAKCRICLKAQGLEELTLQDTLPKSRISISDAVKKSFNIDLSLYPHFPQTICARCYNLVVASYVLKLEILKTDASLRRMAQDINNEMFEKLLNNPALTITKKAPKLVIRDVQHTVSVIPKELVEDVDMKEESEEEEDVITVDEESQHTIEDLQQKEQFESWLDDTQKDSIKNEGKRRIEKFPHQKCKKCKFEAKRLLELLRHIDESSDNCAELYNPTKECYICHRKFMLHTMKIKHIEKDHQDLESTDCNYCDSRSIGNVLLFEKHLRDHFEPPEFACSKCGKKFYNKNNLKLHTCQQKYNCDQCEYEGSSVESITMHMKVHSDF